MYLRLFILIIIIFIFVTISSGEIETFGGSAWFHRGTLFDINQNIQNKIRKMNEMTENFDPNKNVLSEYSKNTVGAVNDLEVIQFEAPENYDLNKQFADYLEVDKYDSGSGDLQNLRKAYSILNSKQYFESLKQLRLRGGNTATYNVGKCELN